MDEILTGIEISCNPETYALHFRDLILSRRWTLRRIREILRDFLRALHDVMSCFDVNRYSLSISITVTFERMVLSKHSSILSRFRGWSSRIVWRSAWFFYKVLCSKRQSERLFKGNYLLEDWWILVLKSHRHLAISTHVMNCSQEPISSTQWRKFFSKISGNYKFIAKVLRTSFEPEI